MMCLQILFYFISHLFVWHVTATASLRHIISPLIKRTFSAGALPMSRFVLHFDNSARNGDTKDSFEAHTKDGDNFVCADCSSVSPMISPGSSPRFIRRSTTPTGIQPAVVPPPLPPRKNSPTLEQNTMPTTSQTPSVSVLESSLQRHLNNGLNEAQSVNNLTHETIEISPISKSNSMQELPKDSTENGNIVELSSPQTICGVIISDCNNIINTKTQARHQSCPSSKSKQHKNCPVKSNTTPNITSKNSETNESHVYENVHIEIPPKHKERYNPLTAKDNATVCYENLNMDYIKKLVSEGYSRDSVIKALGITRNNIDMACDILHEFGTKLG